MDEPTTALDVVVQREILEQIKELQRELGFAVLFITHDLSLLVELSDRIAIMYAGDIVELAPAAELLRQPAPSLHGGADELLPAADGRADRDDRDSRARRRTCATRRRAASSTRAVPSRPEAAPSTSRRCARSSDDRHVACHFPGAAS